MSILYHFKKVDIAMCLNILNTTPSHQNCDSSGTSNFNEGPDDFQLYPEFGDITKFKGKIE